ncbi:hypothetical protein C1H76_7546 [Elsinoe australis]|uniref:Uncharacterized protein n=1 Tax=Elsinoe australis TaxID=40998 RepID=A0A4U7AQ51_9PEZI|nr:hypothetical protein C1H76_7546 [Elsinoe australis]
MRSNKRSKHDRSQDDEGATSDQHYDTLTASTAKESTVGTCRGNERRELSHKKSPEVTQQEVIHDAAEHSRDRSSDAHRPDLTDGHIPKRNVSAGVVEIHDSDRSISSDEENDSDSTQRSLDFSDRQVLNQIQSIADVSALDSPVLLGILQDMFDSSRYPAVWSETTRRRRMHLPGMRSHLDNGDPAPGVYFADVIRAAALMYIGSTRRIQGPYGIEEGAAAMVGSFSEESNRITCILKYLLHEDLRRSHEDIRSAAGKATPCRRRGHCSPDAPEGSRCQANSDSVLRCPCEPGGITKNLPVREGSTWVVCQEKDIESWADLFNTIVDVEKLRAWRQNPDERKTVVTVAHGKAIFMKHVVAFDSLHEDISPYLQRPFTLQDWTRANPDVPEEDLVRLLWPKEGRGPSKEIWAPLRGPQRPESGAIFGIATAYSFRTEVLDVVQRTHRPALISSRPCTIDMCTKCGASEICRPDGAEHAAGRRVHSEQLPALNHLGLEFSEIFLADGWQGHYEVELAPVIVETITRQAKERMRAIQFTLIPSLDDVDRLPLDIMSFH